MMAVADSILDFAVATCQKEYSTIFLYNFPIQDADDTPNHRIFEPRADKQTPMSMHDVDAPSPPKKRTNELRVGHGYLVVLQSCPHNLCLQIYLGVFFRNIWLSYSYIYYFFTHFWSNNLREKNVLNPNPTLTFGASFISIQAFCNTGTLLRRKA